MSVRPNTNRPVIEVKNIVIDTYLRQTVRKLYQNKKSSFREYLLFFNYFLIIIREIVCIHLEDKTLRLYLFDVTLFIGGVRQFNSLFVFLVCVMGIYTFKIIHFSTDVRLMKWIELFQVINGTKDPASIVLTKQKYHLVKFRVFAERFYKISNLTCSMLSKF